MPPAPSTLAQRLYAVLLVALAPVLWLLGRLGVRGVAAEPERLSELRGRPGAARPEGSVLWLHAASLGETRSALGLVDSLRAEGLQDAVLLTTFTRSGAMLAARHGGVIHQYLPWDVGPWVRSFLDHWRPRAAVFVVSEIWPTTVEECRRRGIPMALTGATLSESSRRRFALAARWGLRPLAALSHVSSPDPRHRQRLASLAAVPVTAGPDWKLAAPAVVEDHPLTAELRAAAGDRPLVVFASVHPEEGAALAPALRALAALQPAPLVVVAPRHPARIDGLAQALGVPIERRRSAGDGPAGLFWLDTLGELEAALAAADVAFVGGSLAPLGGHSPAEAARAGCALVMGPHGDNNASVIEALADAGALVRAGADGVGDEVVRLVREPALRGQRGAAARAVVDRWASGCREGAADLLRWLAG